MSALQARHYANRLLELGMESEIHGPDEGGRHQIEVPRFRRTLASVWEAHSFIRFARTHAPDEATT